MANCNAKPQQLLPFTTPHCEAAQRGTGQMPPFLPIWRSWLCTLSSHQDCMFLLIFSWNLLVCTAFLFLIPNSIASITRDCPFHQLKFKQTPLGPECPSSTLFSTWHYFLFKSVAWIFLLYSCEMLSSLLPLPLSYQPTPRSPCACGEADAHLAQEFLSLHMRGGKVWQHLEPCKCFNSLPFAVQIREGPEF